MIRIFENLSQIMNQNFLIWLLFCSSHDSLVYFVCGEYFAITMSLFTEQICFKSLPYSFVGLLLITSNLSSIQNFLCNYSGPFTCQRYHVSYCDKAAKLFEFGLN